MKKQVPAQIDRYLVDGVLGEGGMATVFRVRHAELGTSHALKLLHHLSPGIQARLLQEGRIQATLSHRNVVSVTDVVRHGEEPGLVMQYVAGPTLRQLLRNYQPSVAQIDELVLGILAGVRAIHEFGLIHRDLKPSNILLAIENNTIVPKVADFGLAKVLSKSISGDVRDTRSGASMGTPAYMAPEQFRDAKDVDVRADVFSLGAILYEMVTGMPAFSSEDFIGFYEAVIKEQYRPIRELAPNTPRRMEEAIQRALQPDRDNRIPDCATLQQIWLGEITHPLGDAWEPVHVDLVRTLIPVVNPCEPPQSAATMSFGMEPVEAASAEESPTVDPPAALGDSQVPDSADDTAEPQRLGVWVGLASLSTLLVVLVPVTGIFLAAVVVLVWQEWSATSSIGTTDEKHVSGSLSVGSEAEQAKGSYEMSKPAREDSIHPPEQVPEPSPVSPKVGHPSAISDTQPIPRASKTARVSVEGAKRAYLSRSGERYQVGEVEPGTYSLSVIFDIEPVNVLQVTLRPGEKRHIKCQPRLRICE